LKPCAVFTDYKLVPEGIFSSFRTRTPPRLPQRIGIDTMGEFTSALLGQKAFFVGPRRSDDRQHQSLQPQEIHYTREQIPRLRLVEDHQSRNGAESRARREPAMT